MHVECVALPRELRELGAVDLAFIGLVDERRVGVHPLAYFGEDLYRLFWNRTVPFGADVQQIVALILSALEQIADHGFRRLPIIVVVVIAPAIVHCHAGFPRGGRRLDVLFGRGEVFWNAGTIIDENVWLKLANHAIHLFRFPTFGAQRPIDVVPEHGDFAVVAAEFVHLAMNVIDETAARSFVCFAESAIGVVPIHERIVEAVRQAFGLCGFDIFGDEIAASGLFGCAVVGELGIEVTKAFVMLGGHHHIFHARPL